MVLVDVSFGLKQVGTAEYECTFDLLTYTIYELCRANW